MCWCDLVCLMCCERDFEVLILDISGLGWSFYFASCVFGCNFCLFGFGFVGLVLLWFGVCLIGVV